MDHHQQTQQTEKIIIEMLDFLETSSEEENDIDQQTMQMSTSKDFNDNTFNENIKNNIITKGEKNVKSTSTIANELLKLKQQFLRNTKETDILIDGKTKHDSLNCKTNLNSNSQVEDYDNLDWQYKLEDHCRRSYSNSYSQEIYKAIYQDTAGHPTNGSADYYQAAQNYALYGKHFLDFPENIQVLLNDKNLQNSLTESSNLYSKPNPATPNATTTPAVGLTTAQATAAAYYQICNTMQTQTRPNPGNSAAYGIFLGNKLTYLAGTPTAPSLIYNQHSATTTTNFISNSLANAALATSPTILYTNPMLTTTTQQYLTQFLSTAALTANSLQSATVATNTSGAGIYERLIYAQMLQQQLYQTQQAAAVAAMFQHKQRVAAAAVAARQTTNTMSGNTNRSSPQHLNSTPNACGTNGLTLNSCNRQARSTSPSELVGLKSKLSGAGVATETNDYAKSTSDLS